MNVYAYVCVCIHTHTHTQSDTKVSTQWENGLFIYKTCSVWAPLHWFHMRMRLPSANYIWYHVRISLMRFFLDGPYPVVSPGTAWPSNAPASKNQVGWGLETSEATQRVHGDQSYDLENAILTNGARRYHILMYGDFWVTLCMRVYTCALVIVMFRR